MKPEVLGYGGLANLLPNGVQWSDNSKMTDLVCGAGGLGALGVFSVENGQFEDRQVAKGATWSWHFIG